MEEIPPSASVYDYIVFRGSDVKDISVAEEKKEEKPEPPQVPDDPAILGVSFHFLCLLSICSLSFVLSSWSGVGSIPATVGQLIK